jgi:hypothetical protein
VFSDKTCVVDFGGVHCVEEENMALHGARSCSVHHHFIKSNLDKSYLSNYHPISDLSFLSTLTERVVKSCLNC